MTRTLPAAMSADRLDRKLALILAMCDPHTVPVTPGDRKGDELLAFALRNTSYCDGWDDALMAMCRRIMDIIGDTDG